MFNIVLYVHVLINKKKLNTLIWMTGCWKGEYVNWMPQWPKRKPENPSWQTILKRGISLSGNALLRFSIIVLLDWMSFCPMRSLKLLSSLSLRGRDVLLQLGQKMLLFSWLDPVTWLSRVSKWFSSDCNKINVIVKHKFIMFQKDFVFTLGLTCMFIMFLRLSLGTIYCM